MVVAIAAPVLPASCDSSPGAHTTRPPFRNPLLWLTRNAVGLPISDGTSASQGVRYGTLGDRWLAESDLLYLARTPQSEKNKKAARAIVLTPHPMSVIGTGSARL